MKPAIKYSIIIPHKNIPALLVRCLDSIPPREDTEIIVVDDNSDPTIIDFDHFPGSNREDVKVFFTKKSGGAGYAQNEGMRHATGEWIVFIGADDFFSDDLGRFLDEMSDASEDMVIFDHRSVLSSDISVSVDRSVYLSRLIDDFLCGRIDEDTIRCKYIVSTCKLIKRELIERHHIRFNETKWSNDNYFSAQVSCYSGSVKVCNDVLYVMTVRDESLTSDFCGTRREAMTRLQEAVKSERLLFQHGLTTKKDCLSSVVLRTTYNKHGFWWCMKSCLLYAFNSSVFTPLFGYLYNKAKRRYSL